MPIAERSCLDHDHYSREKRVGGWRDFQKGGNKPKVAKTWKQEEAASTTKPKFGDSGGQDYRKDWK